MQDSKLYFVVDAQTGLRRPVAERGIDLVFPEGIRGWADVLDCRHPPFREKTLTELRQQAQGVNKPFVLIEESQLDPT
jgi:hypothetical protein